MQSALIATAWSSVGHWPVVVAVVAAANVTLLLLMLLLWASSTKRVAVCTYG